MLGDYNLTAPLDTAMYMDVNIVDCDNATERRYVNGSFLAYKQLTEDAPNLFNLLVDLKMIRNLMNVAYENIQSIDYDLYTQSLIEEKETKKSKSNVLSKHKNGKKAEPTAMI